jgi:hypothetical protein
MQLEQHCNSHMNATTVLQQQCNQQEASNIQCMFGAGFNQSHNYV